jgi:hypothetical protein
MLVTHRTALSWLRRHRSARRVYRALNLAVTPLERLESRIAPVVGAFQKATIVPPGTPSATGIVEVIAPNQTFGTGELLSTGRDILTAAHVVTNGQGVLLKGNFTVVFELPQLVTLTVPSTAITVNPNWTGNVLQGNDLAILALPSSAPAAATRNKLNTATNEVGQTFTTEGYGLTGVGDTGAQGQLVTSAPGTLRMAQNRFEATNDVFNLKPLHPFPPTSLPQAGFPAGSALVFDFDNGKAANDAMGYFYGINNLGLGNAEGLPAEGDSGGPGVLGNTIASIASYTIGFPGPPDILPGNNSSFGDVAVATRVSYYAGWINSVINVNRLQVTLPPMVTAGTPFNITVTAVNAYGMAVTGYQGVITFTTSDPSIMVGLPFNYQFVAADNGRHTFTVAEMEGSTLITAGAQSITATDIATASVTGFGDTTVVAASTSQFLVETFAPMGPTPLPEIEMGVFGPVGTNTPFIVGVVAQDRFGNKTPSYTGTVHFMSTDAAAKLPADYTFNRFDGGAHLFPVTSPVIFKTAGDQTITVTDTTDATITGSTMVRVLGPDTVLGFLVTAPANVTAGNQFAVVVQALNIFGGIVTGYRGTVQFRSTDTNPMVSLPANYMFAPGDNGVHTFNGVILVTAGAQTISVMDTTNLNIAGARQLTVMPAATSNFLITPAAPNVVPNVAFGVTVTARDSFNNTTPAYRGTIRFTSSDAAAGVVLPADYMFTAADNGVHSFAGGVTLITAGAQTITATDTAVAATTGTGNVTVGPAIVSRYMLVAPANPVGAGTGFMLTVTALDALGNVVTNYMGTVHFTSSDKKAGVVLPADYMFVAGDKGVHMFNGVVLATAGTQTITARDTVSMGVSGSAQIKVNPANASTLIIKAAAALVLQGVPSVITVTAQDRFGNTATGYRGTVKVTSGDAKAVLPANYTFTAADNGVHTFFGTSAVTLNTLGDQTVTVMDTVAAALNAKTEVTVIAPAAATGFQVTILAPNPSTLPGLQAVPTGTPFAVVVTVVDANGFVTPSYLGTINFTSMDPNAGIKLPANYTFVAGDLGTHTFSGVVLITRGIQTIVATDTKNASLAGRARVVVQ